MAKQCQGTSGGQDRRMGKQKVRKTLHILIGFHCHLARSSEACQTTVGPSTSFHHMSSLYTQQVTNKYLIFHNLILTIHIKSISLDKQPDLDQPDREQIPDQPSLQLLLDEGTPGQACWGPW